MGSDVYGKDLSYNDCGDGGFQRLGSIGETGEGWFSLDNLLLAGLGVGVVGILGYGYYVYSKASTVATAAGNFGTSLNSVGIGGFKLVPAT